MPISTNSKFILAEPGDGRTVLSMDGGEFNLFGKYTAIKTTAVDTYDKINDFLAEKKVENPVTYQFVFGIAVTALLAGLAVAAVGIATGLTGGLALVAMGAAAGFARASIETGIYAATAFASDTVTGSSRSFDDYAQGLAISGGIGFVTGAISYLNPIITFTPGPSLSLAGGGTLTAAIPTIVTNAADTVLVMDRALGITAVLSAAMGVGGGSDKEGIQFDEGEYDDWYDSNKKLKRPIKGKQFRGGNKKSRDKWYGIKDKSFQKWWERVGKSEWGGGDIQDSKMAQEIYDYWKDIGSPNANGGRWK